MGMGNRGTAYAAKLLKYPQEAEVTAIDRSVESYYMAFAAEQSRMEGGRLIEMEQFKKEIGA